VTTPTLCSNTNLSADTTFACNTQHLRSTQPFSCVELGVQMQCLGLISAHMQHAAFQQKLLQKYLQQLAKDVISNYITIVVVNPIVICNTHCLWSNSSQPVAIFATEVHPKETLTEPPIAAKGRSLACNAHKSCA
jgi:hypothetical protein